MENAKLLARANQAIVETQEQIAVLKKGIERDKEIIAQARENLAKRTQSLQTLEKSSDSEE